MSTTDPLEDYSGKINGALDKKKFALALLLYMKKAFDAVDHTRMLKKFNDFGFRGPFLNLFLRLFHKPMSSGKNL